MWKRFWLSAIFCGVFLSTQACTEMRWRMQNAAGQEAYEQVRYDEAEKAWLLALQEAENFGPADPRLATSLDNLALLYHAQGNYAEAEPLYQRALAIWEKALGAEHPDVATSLNNLAGFYRLSRGVVHRPKKCRISASARVDLLARALGARLQARGFLLAAQLS